MILVDNSGRVDINGAADDVMVQGFLAAVSAARVYAAGKKVPVQEALNIISALITLNGMNAVSRSEIEREEQ